MKAGLLHEKTCPSEWRADAWGFEQWGSLSARRRPPFVSEFPRALLTLWPRLGDAGPSPVSTRSWVDALGVTLQSSSPVVHDQGSHTACPQSQFLLLLPGSHSRPSAKSHFYSLWTPTFLLTLKVNLSFPLFFPENDSGLLMALGFLTALSTSIFIWVQGR